MQRYRHLVRIIVVLLRKVYRYPIGKPSGRILHLRLMKIRYPMASHLLLEGLCSDICFVVVASHFSGDHHGYDFLYWFR